MLFREAVVHITSALKTCVYPRRSREKVKDLVIKKKNKTDMERKRTNPTALWLFHMSKAYRKA